MIRDMKHKEGISLLALIITVIVLAIIASVAMYVSADAVNNASMVAFSSDLTEIEDLVDEYYLNNNELPIIDGISYNKQQVVALISNSADVLSGEITENNDDSATFYKLDLSKLPINNISRGIEKDGDSTDIYLVSSENFNVYYLKGEKIADVYYFSLTEKLTGKKRLDSNVQHDDSSITISTTTAGIKLTKSTADWTSLLTVNVETTLEAGETLEYLVANTVIGTSTTATFTVDVTQALQGNTEATNNFNSSDENKVFIVNKYSTVGETKTLVATAKIAISNLDILSGDVASLNISYAAYNDFILANVNGYTDLGGSGLKEARVLYTKKLDDSGNEVSYYETLPSSITEDYVKNAGKSSSATVIKLPVDVAEFKIVFIDNAGNVSLVTTHTVAH